MNGASVSTRTSSGGVTAAASRRCCAFLNVTFPAKLMKNPRRAHSFANAASPEKQWRTTRSGAPSASRIDRTSSWASRSWMTSAFPRSFAIAMCARNERCCAARPVSSVRK